MAKPYPNVDLFDVEEQRIRNEAESIAYGPSGGLATDDAINGVYVDGFRGPRISVLMHDVLTRSDIWRLGNTTVAVSKALGTDHTVISRAWRWGVLSAALEGYLMALRSRPADLDQALVAAREAQHRAGFMAVANHLSQRMQTGVWPKEGSLCEIHCELLFDLGERRREWMVARHNGDCECAHLIALGVCQDPKRQILLPWFTKRRARQVRDLANRLCEDAQFAFRYLCLLQARWEGIFALTSAATEENVWLAQLEGK
jgi:hypothetical protein